MIAAFWEVSTSNIRSSKFLDKLEGKMKIPRVFELKKEKEERESSIVFRSWNCILWRRTFIFEQNWKGIFLLLNLSLEIFLEFLNLTFYSINNCNIFLWFCIMNLLMFQNEYSNDVNEQFLEIQILTENREIFHYSSIFIA